jgi:CelD/BcsL family acetyltransferase involved in cellulose biosynthesis
MRVIGVDPASDADWQRLQAGGGAGLFHTQPWFAALADTYALSIRALVVLDDAGTPIAGLACCQIDDVLGPRLVALPFSDACDPLVRSQMGWDALLAHLAQGTSPVHLRFLDFVSPDEGTSLEVIKRARWHRLNLESPVSSLWSSLAAANRRAIRKAERSGLAVLTLEDEDELQRFHALHVSLRKRKYHLLAQPFAFFQAIGQRFRAVDGWYPLGAYLDGRLIAGALFLHWGDTLYYKFNASEETGLHLRPNNLLIWSGIQLAKSLGCRWLDLGPSDDDQPGLVRFKRDFGAAESELRHLRISPAAAVHRDTRQIRRLLGDITALLTTPQVPDEVSAEAGAMLYRLFA